MVAGSEFNRKKIEKRRLLGIPLKKKVLNVLELWEDFLENVPFEEMQIESILYVAFRIKNNFRASFRAIFEPSFLNSFRSSLFTSLFNLINHEHTFHKYSFDCHIFVTFPIQKSQENANFRENSKKDVRIFFFQFKVTWPTTSAKVHFQSNSISNIQQFWPKNHNFKWSSAILAEKAQF